MFSKLESKIAFRYLFTKRREKFVSIISWVSLIGIMLGVATLIIVMSVMSGFHDTLLSRIIGMNGHIVIYHQDGTIKDYDYLIDKITDYWYEYVTDNIAFLKKEVLFISEFFHLINFSIFPISIEEIEYQIANIENNDQEFLNNSIILNKKVSNTLLKYKTFKEMSEVEKKLFDLFICFFVGGVEDSELIIEYASYDLLTLGVPEETIIKKLYQHFGDIIDYQERQ